MKLITLEVEEMLSTKVQWYIDTYLLDNNPEQMARVKDAMRANAFDVKYLKYKPFTTKQDDLFEVDLHRANILYGTHGFIRNMRNTFGPEVFTAYCNEEVMRTINYYPRIVTETLLNGYGLWISFDTLKENYKRICDYFQSNSLFVRPDSGFKAFSPTVLNYDRRDESSIERDINILIENYQIHPNTLCLVNRAQKIHSETRFIIVDGNIVDSSFYRMDGKLKYKNGCDRVTQKVVEKFLKGFWIPDRCFTCDVAVTDDGPKIIELNAFSCAGLYDCDYKLVFDAVSRCAVKYMGEKNIDGFSNVRHAWKDKGSGGVYDHLYVCSECDERFMESADKSFKENKRPEYGCKV